MVLSQYGQKGNYLYFPKEDSLQKIAESRSEF